MDRSRTSAYTAILQRCIAQALQLQVRADPLGGLRTRRHENDAVICADHVELDKPESSNGSPGWIANILNKKVTDHNDLGQRLTSERCRDACERRGREHLGSGKVSVFLLWAAGSYYKQTITVCLQQTMPVEAHPAGAFGRPECSTRFYHPPLKNKRTMLTPTTASQQTTTQVDDAGRSAMGAVNRGQRTYCTSRLLALALRETLKGT